MKAKIFEIKRFAVHDGPGIRTTVFFKGCPLTCVWCHNPEGIAFQPQLAFYKNKCISCGECVRVCAQHAHTLQDGIHKFDREKCQLCGKGEKACFRKALTLYGKDVTVDGLMSILLEDAAFYRRSGGGVTLSGGECLAQAEFCTALLKQLKANGIGTAVDTCGFVSREALDSVMPYTDIFLYDMKAFDEKVHINCTGQTNKPILENLKYLDACGKEVEIRIPYVPKFNDNQIGKIALFLRTLTNITRIKVLPYHNYAGSKFTSLAMPNTLPDTLPNEEELQSAISLLRKYGLTVAD